MKGDLEGKDFVLNQYLKIESDPDPKKSRVAGNLNSRIWAGTHTFLIRGTNGIPNDAPDARGEGGIFATIDSAYLTIVVTDPCDDAVINFDNSFYFPSSFVVPESAAKIQDSLPGPTDSVSAVNAPSRHDFCGPMLYTLTFKNGAMPPNLYFEVFLKKDAADIIQYNLESVRTGLKIKLEAQFSIKLVGYPMIAPLVYKTQFIYRECLPTDFKAPFIEDQRIVVGDARKELDVEFS